MSRKTYRSDFAKLDALYARLPTIACVGKCGVSCGPIPLTRVEAARLQRADPQHAAPRTCGDRGVQCVYLTTAGRCRVYAVRPLICRVWGLVKRLSCPFGCVPDRWLTDHEFVASGKVIERLGAGHVVTTPAGVQSVGDRMFADLPTDRVTPDVADAYADMTRAARALHGGRVIGITPTPAGEIGGWIDVDAVRAERERKP